MATRIEIEYDRRVIQSEVQYILARASAGLNVLQQLGTAYQSLPGLVMTTMQTETDALETDVQAVNALVNQIRVLLESIDNKAEDLAQKNKNLLLTLRGLLQNDAQLVLLDQITGPTETPSSPPTPPPVP
jgi:ABC-type transporter Mla subunit MlaD